MRILLLTPGAYGVNGGIGLYTRDLIDALDAVADVNEIAVIPREHKSGSEAIPASVRVARQAVGGKAAFSIAVLKALARRFDIVICGHVNLLPLAVLAKLRCSCPLVLMVYGIDVWERPGFAGALVGKVNTVWSISDITRDRMNAWAGLPTERYAVLPNAIHLERYGVAEPNLALRRRLGLEGHKTILTLARLPGYDRYKGVDEVLECMPSLLDAEPTLAYLVVGDGEDRPRLEAKAKDLGIAARVIFTGYVSEQEKADYYRLADAFVLPGRGEGFGFVFLEALACGVPVVGSLLDGSREALRGGLVGELVDPRDLDSVKNGILKALAKPIEIPPELDYFAWPAFKDRVANAVCEARRTNIGDISQFKKLARGP